MKSRTCYVTIKKLEELTGLKCLHLDLDTLSDELIIESLKSELSSEEYPYYYIFRHKSDEINADSKKIFLGVFLLGSIKPFDSSKIHHVFDLYKKSHTVNTIPKEEYYLSKQEFISRGLTHSDSDISSKNSKTKKNSFADTCYSNESNINARDYINATNAYKNNLSTREAVNEYANNTEVNSNEVIEEAVNEYANNTEVNSNEVVEEDLNEAARNFSDYTYGVINNLKHIDKISNIEGVEMLGVNDASQCSYFKVASENTNKVLGQSVRIQPSVLDSDLLDFYKKDK